MNRLPFDELKLGEPQFDNLLDAMTDELDLAIIMIEACGSLGLLEELGWFRYRRTPEEVLGALRMLVPASRGGNPMGGVHMEAIWEKRLNKLIDENGYDAVEQIREKLEEILDEVASKQQAMEKAHNE